MDLKKKHFLNCVDSFCVKGIIQYYDFIYRANIQEYDFNNDMKYLKHDYHEI